MITCRSLFRSKSLSVLIGKQFGVYWLYFNKGLILFWWSTYIGMYLFHIYKMCKVSLSQLVLFKRLFCTIQQLLVLKSAPVLGSVLIYATFHSIYIRCLNCSSFGLFPIELAYSHNLLFRLFFGLMSINAVFVLINLARRKVVYIDSFYYEYSYLSIFSKESTNPNGHHLL